MINRLRLTLRQLGLLDGCWYLLAAALTRASSGRWRLFKYRLVAQPIHARALCGTRGRAIEVHPVGPDLADSQQVRPPAVIRRRFAAGAQCLAAYRAGTMAGFLWYCPGPYVEDEVRARYVPAPAAVWDFDVAVFDEHQLGFTFVRLWDEANRRLHAGGVRWTMSRISAFNPASRASHGRLGAVRLGSAVFLRCGRWQWTAATLRPFLHLSRCADSMPHFRLSAPAHSPIQP
jgi:hypothetical protein